MVYFSEFDIESLKYKEILEYFLYLYNQKKYSVSRMKQIIGAVKFFYERILGKARVVYDLDIKKEDRIAKEKEVLDKEEVVRLFKVVNNIKHKAILATIYSAGLRVGELINLKISDIDSKRMVITIRNGKGNRDRISILSEKLLILLRKYFLNYKPKLWLFEGINNSQYSISSVQQIFKKAIKDANITPKFTVHSLRHSFSTHLLENGVKLKEIQNILGHSNSKTTEIYTHVRENILKNIKSPIDEIELSCTSYFFDLNSFISVKKTCGYIFSKNNKLYLF